MQYCLFAAFNDVDVYYHTARGDIRQWTKYNKFTN